MANSYTDVPEIKFHMQHPLMKRIVELKERNFADYGQYDYAPKDYEDALDNYDRLLEMIKPQFVHVLYKGRIVKTGGPELAVQIQEHGYDWIKEEIGEE